MAAVHHGGKVLVLTVDPARRLANALGLETFGNVETRVPPEAFAEAGVEPRGELWAAMLDTKQSWDDLVRRHAPDAATRDAILANPLYKNITGRFVQSHDYIAMERLYEIHASGTYDLIVVDTPPTRNAIDFLEAPERMADFFSSRLLRWLTVPARSRVLTMASKPFYSVADRILGSKFLEDIAEFFLLFQTMYDGFVDRAKAVTRTLEDKPHHLRGRLHPRVGAGARGRVLHRRARRPRPPPRRGRAQQGAARAGSSTRAPPAPPRRCAPAPTSWPRCCRTRIGAPEQVGRVLREVGESFLNFQVVAKREAEIRAELSAAPEVVAAVPVLRPRHHRPRRPARPRPADLAVTRPAPVAVASGHPATTAAAIEVLRGRRQRRRRLRRGRLRGGGRRADAHEPGRRRVPPRPHARRARRCCSTSSSTRRASAGRRRARRSTSTRWSCSSPAPSRPSTSGLGSVAVPGCLAGWLHAHRRLGRVDARRWSPRPARRLAAEGVEVNDQQAYLLAHPRADPHPHARGGRHRGARTAGSSAAGDRLTNPALAAFLGDARRAGLRRARAWPRRSSEPWTTAAACSPPPTSTATRSSSASRWSVQWRGHRLLTNPPPAFGGELVALGLLELEARPGLAGRPSARWRTPSRWPRR